MRRERTAPGEGQAGLKPLIIPPARMKEYSQAPVLRRWAFFDLLFAQARGLILVGTAVRDDAVLLVNSPNLLRRRVCIWKEPWSSIPCRGSPRKSKGWRKLKQGRIQILRHMSIARERACYKAKGGVLL